LEDFGVTSLMCIEEIWSNFSGMLGEFMGTLSVCPKKMFLEMSKCLTKLAKVKEFQLRGMRIL
jgi:hypothetical protein